MLACTAKAAFYTVAGPLMTANGVLSGFCQRHRTLLKFICAWAAKLHSRLH